MGMPKNQKAMRTHRALAVLYLGLGAIFFFVFSTSSSGRGGWELGLPLLIMVPGVIHGLVAYGAARSASWARVASIVIAVLMLAGFPLGTLIGIYLLANSSWASMREMERPAPI